MGAVLTDPFGWIGQTLLELLTRLGLQQSAANLVISLLAAVFCNRSPTASNS
jgi:hypothetical protein